MDLIKKENNIAELGVGEKVLLELVQVDKEANEKLTGLYHIAYLLPTRADLGNALFSLLVRNAPIYSASDHGYSEALYLNDPEGNGIEIYADRPKEKWDIREDGTIAGYTIAIDAEGVLAEKISDAPVNLPEGTIIGHVHLSIKDLEKTKDFYTNILGFDNKFEFPRQAIFMASGLYHHHIAINI
nr:VOC family protein [Helcococcus sueciensis]